MNRHKYYMLKKNGDYPKENLIEKTILEQGVEMKGRFVYGILVYKNPLSLYTAFSYALAKEEYKKGESNW